MRFAYFSPNTWKLFVVTLLWTGSGGVFNSDAKWSVPAMDFRSFVSFVGSSVRSYLLFIYFSFIFLVISQMKMESIQFLCILLDVRRRCVIYLAILSEKLHLCKCKCNAMQCNAIVLLTLFLINIYVYELTYGGSWDCMCPKIVRAFTRKTGTIVHFIEIHLIFHDAFKGIELWVCALLIRLGCVNWGKFLSKFKIFSTFHDESTRDR